MEELIVDLKRPPGERWSLSPTRIEQARRLFEVYFGGMEAIDGLVDMAQGLAEAVLPEDYRLEIESLARQLEEPAARVLLCNAYDDLLKSRFGCTAFAVDTEQGPLHARNLDWWTENRLLADNTMIARFVGAPAGEFVTVGWPGFVGAFSGMAPGRFAITLNAVFSGEPTQLATPVVFLIRSVLEEAASFAEAVERLSGAPIPSDCLLLVTGARTGEMVVIERTPTRHALRGPEGAGVLCATNDYLSMAHEAGEPKNELEASSCSRYDRISQLLNTASPTPEECFTFLSDPEIVMDITVQQMVFRPSDGMCRWRIP